MTESKSFNRMATIIFDSACYRCNAADPVDRQLHHFQQRHH